MACDERRNPTSCIAGAATGCPDSGTELAWQPSAPCTGKLSKLPECLPGFYIATREFAPMLSKTDSDASAFIPRESTLSRGHVNLPWPLQSAMENRNFLLCSE